MESEKTFTLSNGLKMPLVGLGTFNLFDKTSIMNAITEAGYRHLDTASFYKTEPIIAEALEEIFSQGTLKREDIFITTKLFHDQHRSVEFAVKESLARLKLEYIDLYLIHWPDSFFDDSAQVPLHILWGNLEHLVDQGLIRSLGVSNFNVQLLADLLTYARHKPVCNQIELHPYNTQVELIRFLQDHHILPVAYCPVGRSVDPNDTVYLTKSKKPDLKDNEGIQAIAKKHNKSEFQVLLRFGVQRGCAVIPKATSLEHQRSNIEIFDFALDQEDMDYIYSLNVNYRICNKLSITKGYDIFA